MTFVEHNNREKANKFAEYVTGKPLREYLAQKVKQYCGEKYIRLRWSCRLWTVGAIYQYG